MNIFIVSQKCHVHIVTLFIVVFCLFFCLFLQSFGNLKDHTSLNACLKVKKEVTNCKYLKRLLAVRFLPFLLLFISSYFWVSFIFPPPFHYFSFVSPLKLFFFLFLFPPCFVFSLCFSTSFIFAFPSFFSFTIIFLPPFFLYYAFLHPSSVFWFFGVFFFPFFYISLFNSFISLISDFPISFPQYNESFPF